MDLQGLNTSSSPPHKQTAVLITPEEERPCFTNTITPEPHNLLLGYAIPAGVLIIQLDSNSTLYFILTVLCEVCPWRGLGVGFPPCVRFDGEDKGGESVH